MENQWEKSKWGRGGKRLTYVYPEDKEKTLGEAGIEGQVLLLVESGGGGGGGK